MSTNRNIIIDLERMKGEKINNISHYNNAVQRQIIQNQQKMYILKYKNEVQNKYQSKFYGIKTYNCNC